jgi:hypothetical protein
MNAAARETNSGGQSADRHGSIVLGSRIGASDIADPARRFYEGK